MQDDGLSLKTVRDLRDIDEIRPTWKAWQATRDSDIDFFSAIVRSRSESCRPNITVLSRNSRPEALLVGLTDRVKTSFCLGPVTVRGPEIKALQFAPGCLLGTASADNCSVLVRRVIHSLLEGEADIAFWEHLDLTSPLFEPVVRLPGFLSRDHFPIVQDHWFINSPKGLDPFLSTLGRNQRSKLIRKYKRILKQFPGGVEVRSFRTAEDLQQAMSDMEEIARKSNKRPLGYGFIDTPQNREQLLVEATKGWLRIYILYIDGKPVSFWKGSLYDRFLKADHTGFDVAWSSLSPGIFLLLKILELSYMEDVSTVDFGFGDGQLQHCFGKVRKPKARVLICVPRARSLQVQLLHSLTRCAAITVDRVPTLSWVSKALWKKKQAAALKQISFNRSSGTSQNVPTNLVV